MAKILYEVKQCQNTYTSAYGKWYAQIKNLETLNTRKLANHISEHGSIYTPDVVYGVLEKFRSCMLEMLLNSKKVKIDGLGTFYCTLENQKRGADRKEDYNVTKHIKGLHIRFLPEQTTEENISSREFLKKAEFIDIDTIPSQYVKAPTISGTTPFTTSTQVTMSGPEGAQIRYTTDGTKPTAESTLYSEAITLSSTTTVKAIAIKDGKSSEVSTKTFTKNG
jgi:predicted histone-like DNA-binding protein